MGPASPVEQIFREHSGRLLAWLILALGDFDAAEDALQEAFVIALRRWPESGVPDDPRGWLAVTARNRAIDRLRRERKRPEIETEMTRLLDGADEPDGFEDEQLRLIFTCCHPALSIDTRVALTLRSVGGLTGAEIATAFLVSEAALAQRIVRAKRKIAAARIPYEVPGPDKLAARLQGVLAVLYLIFNEGYMATGGATLARTDLCDDAIRLARVLSNLMPSEPEVRSLLALMLLIDSRRGTRVDAAGELVLLADQDRAQWDGPRIREGLAELAQAGRHGTPGPYALQAAIAAEHARAPNHESTDWHRIARLYGRLAAVRPSPVIELNRLVAVSLADGPAAALAPLADLESALDRYPYFHAARADMLSRLGRRDEAAGAYRRALELATNAAQRSGLARSVAELETGA